MRASVTVFAIALLILAVGCTTPRARDMQAPDSALREFVRRAQAYAALHRRIVSEGPALESTNDLAELASRKDELARRLHDARADAKPGDVFTKEAAEPIRRLIRMHETSSLEKEPSAPESPQVRPRVNARYPDSEPLPSMPPTLLAALPEIPEEIQYRLIGSDLTLLDAETRIVVDVLPDVRK